MSELLSEHLGYLNLEGRSDLFDQAIAQVLQEGDVVADLGCGLGVLGLQCLKAGAERAYGIDHSAAIHLANEMAKRAGLTDRYICLEGATFDVSLPEPVDLLICDHVGFFGFDYGIVPMMRDAERRFLKPGGSIMPDRLKMSIAGVVADDVYRAVTGWTDDKVPAELHWLARTAANSKHACQIEPSQICTDAAELGEIELERDAGDFFSSRATLTVSRDGVFGGVAGWFDAHLGGDIWMTNSPLKEAAIQRPQAFLPVETPFEVQSGDRITITVKARLDGDLIAWSVEPQSGSAKQEMSSWTSLPLGGSDLASAAARPVADETAVALSRILALADGERTTRQIEDAIIEEFPDLKPSEQASRDFVRRAIKRYCKT